MYKNCLLRDPPTSKTMLMKNGIQFNYYFSFIMGIKKMKLNSVTII